MKHAININRLAGDERGYAASFRDLSICHHEGTGDTADEAQAELSELSGVIVADMHRAYDESLPLSKRIY